MKPLAKNVAHVELAPDPARLGLDQFGLKLVRQPCDRIRVLRAALLAR